MKFRGRVLVAGEGGGRPLVLSEPLSLWGGLDPHTGEIIDRRHPQSGQNVAGRVLIMPSGRGSSSASNILLQAVKEGRAPAAILLAEADPILALGAVVARELYRRAPPVVVLRPQDYRALCRLARQQPAVIRVAAEGNVSIDNGIQP